MNLRFVCLIFGFVILPTQGRAQSEPIDPSAFANSWVNNPELSAYANDSTADVDQVVIDLTVSKSADPTAAYVAKKIEIPMVFTILYDSALTPEWYDAYRDEHYSEIVKSIIPNVIDGRSVTVESIHKAMDQLNEFYQGHQIRFVFYDGVADPVRYVDSPDFFFVPWTSENLVEMRAELMALHGVDYPNVLNVFLHATDLAEFVGLGAFPSDRTNNDDLLWGVNIDFRFFPNIPGLMDPGENAKDYSKLPNVISPHQLRYAEYNTTLMHEVGHCLGLFHTFTSSTPLSEGDMVDDTPFEAVPFFGDGIIRNERFAPFPLDRNTADDSWYWYNGKDPTDPVRNLMDYGSFHYREAELTKGQVDLVFRQIALYAPEFVSHDKPAKPAEDRLIVFADFESEDLSDAQVTNKVKHGKQTPLYLPETDDACLVERQPDNDALSLSGGSRLYVSAVDLDTNDARQVAKANTIAFWLKLGDINQMDDTIFGLPFTPVYHIPDQGMSTYRSLDIIHDIPYPGYSLFRWWVYPQFEWFYAPTVYFENQWVHFAIVYDRDRGMSYYLNGMHIGDGGLSYEEMGAWAGFVMGRITRYLTYDDGTYEPIDIPMSSAVDDLALYNFALSPEEVLELVYHGAPDGWLKGNFRDQIHAPDDQQKAAFEALFSPER